MKSAKSLWFAIFSVAAVAGLPRSGVGDLWRSVPGGSGAADSLLVSDALRRTDLLFVVPLALASAGFLPFGWLARPINLVTHGSN